MLMYIWTDHVYESYSAQTCLQCQLEPLQGWLTVPAVRRDIQGSWHHCSRAVSCSASFHRTLNERSPHAGIGISGSGEGFAACQHR